MPWHVGKSDECPPSKPYAVIKDDDGSVAGCHETEAKAQAQMRALYANEGGKVTARPMKAEQLGSSKWRVLAIPFGGPFAGKDLDDEYFSPRTDIKRDWFDKRPTMFHHGQDEWVKDETLGIEEMDDAPEKDGWWGTVWLDRANQYWARVNSLLQSGKMYGSSGALGHLVRKDHKTGEILVWPHIEQTLTPTPANPYSRVVPSKAFDHLYSAGIAVDARKAALLTEPAPDLGPDLPRGGEDPALVKLAATLDQLEETLRRLRR